MRALAAQQGNGEIPDLKPVLARRVTVLGSTGSIGVSTLDVIAHARRQYGADVLPVEALTANGNVEKLVEQAKAIKPKPVKTRGSKKKLPNSLHTRIQTIR